jgi:hypothetical protein
MQPSQRSKPGHLACDGMAGKTLLDSDSQALAEPVQPVEIDGGEVFECRRAGDY